jgi:hypothetical protein
MLGFHAWGDSYFNIVQTAGIIGTLLLGIAVANREAKAKETENLLAIAEHHRELWTEANQRPELNRIYNETADTTTQPVTAGEENFLNLVFAHFLTTWRIGELPRAEGLLR